MRTRHGVRATVAILAGSLVLLAGAVPVVAAPALRVTIESHVTFNPDGPNYGSFTASGPAVDAGVLCDTGTFVDTGIRFNGFRSDRGVVQLQVDKAFICDDGGTFAVKMQIQANFEPGSSRSAGSSRVAREPMGPCTAAGRVPRSPTRRSATSTPTTASCS